MAKSEKRKAKSEKRKEKSEMAKSEIFVNERFIRTYFLFLLCAHLLMKCYFFWYS